ncbi:MAG: hypothetical protein AB2L18_04845 [Anaerolineaceae bacterium]
MRKTYTRLIFILLILALLGFEISSIARMEDDTYNIFDISFSATPTPYSLSAQSYNQSSHLQIILEQIFNKFFLSKNSSSDTDNDRKIVSTAHFDVYVRRDYYSIDTSWLRLKIEQIYDYESSRLSKTLLNKINVTFLPPEAGSCAPRGTTYFEQQPFIFLYADQNTDDEQILAVLAHELGHVFIHYLYPDLSDIALNEGMATWIAEDYWTTWKGHSFDDEVRLFLKDNTYFPLYLNQDMTKAYEKSNKCLENRDILLTEFASFIDFLNREYGSDYLSSLFHIQQPKIINNQRIVYPPDYKGIYSLELNQLENEWLRNILKK